MTQYVTTFHQRPGLYTGDIVPIPELTPMFNSAQANMEIVEGQVGLPSLATRLYNGVDERAMRFWPAVAGWTSSKIHAYTLTAAQTPFAAGHVAVSSRFKVSTTLGTALIIRASGTSALPNGYVALFRQSNNPSTPQLCSVEILKLSGGAWASIAGPVTKDMTGFLSTDGNNLFWANMLLSANGTSISATFWPMGAQQPAAADVTVVDATYPGGWAGAGIGDPFSTINPDDGATFGYISVSDTFAVTPYIPKNHEDRRTFFEESANVSTVLFMAGVLGTPDYGTTGLPGYALISNTGFVTQPGDIYPNAVFDSVLTSITDFSQAINDSMLGRATQSFGDAVVNNESRRLDDWLRWNWDGRDFRIFLGHSSWRFCDFQIVARGTIERVEQRAWNQIAFKLRDASNLLARRIQSKLIGGTEPTAGRVQPIVFGTPFNVTPVLKSSNTHRYKVSDRPLFNITGIRENGASILGSAVLDLPNGEFTLAASPAGTVTCDPVAEVNPVLYGSVIDNTGPYFNSMFNRVAYLYSALADDQIYPRTLDISSSDLASNFIDQDDVTVDSVLDEITQSAAAFWYWTRWGELKAHGLDLTRAYKATFPAYSAYPLFEDDLTNKQLRLVRLLPPVEAVRRVLRSKNFTVQDTGTLAGVLSETLRALYSNPGTIETNAASSTTLDAASNHLLAQQRELWETLITGPLGASLVPQNSIATRDRENFKTAVGVFEFSTRRWAMEYEMGEFTDIVHSKYGFQNGARGQITKISRNYRSRRATLNIAVQLPGLWPSISAAFPFVAEGDFE